MMEVFGQAGHHTSPLPGDPLQETASLSAWSPDLQFPLFATGENGNVSLQQQPLDRDKMGLTLWTTLLYFLVTDLC